ncbi:MAG: YibE/F family protein [Clostridia bacterium]|nr:YibE/F family protein [Clostridia bacterium]
MKKDTVKQIITLAVSLILVFAGYHYVLGGGTVFKGTAQGDTIKARVIRITDEKTNNITGDAQFTQVTFNAQVLTGSMRGKTVEVIQEIDGTYAFSPRKVEQNDKILIESASDESGTVRYYFGDYYRVAPLIVLGVIFCALVMLFSKSQGFKTIVSLGVTCLAVFCVLIPAVLSDKNIYLWSIIICVFITAVTLSLVSGFNKKSACALLGCLSGVACAGVITLITNLFLNMTGLLEEESIYLYRLYPDNPIDMKAILFAMIIVGALGAVMDVAMSISSSLWELRQKSPSITRGELMKSGFRIGGDMMGTMANTLVLAYIGSNLTCVLLLISYNANIHQVVNREIIVFEILQALAGSLGMLLALPLTSFICAMAYYGKEKVKTDAALKNEPSAHKGEE